MSRPNSWFGNRHRFLVLPELYRNIKNLVLKPPAPQGEKELTTQRQLSFKGEWNHNRLKTRARTVLVDKAPTTTPGIATLKRSKKV